MTDAALNRPPVHALLADGITVCIRSVVPGDHAQLEGLYEEMSPKNLRLSFFAASRRSAALSADRACAPPHPGNRALPKGVVTLSGQMERKSETEIAVSMTRRIYGVVAVVDKLTWRLGDARLRPDKQAVHGVADDRLRKL